MLNSTAPRPSLRGGVLLLCVCAFFCAAVARADDVEDAQKLLKAGQSQQALERVNKALAANPKEPQARFLKGVILTEQGKQSEAIEIFTKLTQDYPSLPEPYNNLAVIYASQGQYEKARTSLEQSIRTHPTYATAYENLGDVYAKLASQAYGKALQIDASNTTAQNKLSLVRELVREPSAKPAAVAAASDTAKEAPKAAVPAATVAAVAPKAPEKPAADASGDVLKAVNGWAQAWSKKDASGYLGYYAKDFKTPAGESRGDWEKSRRERIGAAKSISVAIESPKVTMRGADQASVSFRQTYKSDKLTSKNRKTLELVKVDNRWLIKEEKAGK
ncbi:MAG TPA: tetratricopeptide repeat protein [Burkholderiales bacterium]|jgi:tetratricopeptide (TPR) repeat protein|nr:tetratricopeptide repeat protein [Burkholderiales bacterium]